MLFATVLLAGAMQTLPRWHDAKAIVVPHITKATYVRLDLPQSIDGGGTSEYPDLRVADAQNNEVPYALDAIPARPASEPVTLSDVGFVAGKYTQAIADLGESGQLHSSIQLQTPRETYFERVEIASSDDRRNWAVVQPSALIYRVASSNDAGTDEIPFGATRARWLRIRVLDASGAFPITGASTVAHATPPKLVPLTARTTIKSQGTQSVATLDFLTRYTNLTAVAFETQTPQFSRKVAFAISDGIKSEDSSTWEQLDGATISRFATGKPALTVDLHDQRAQLLRVTIENGNDPPLAALRVTALGIQHHIIFLAEPGQSYRLIWLNDEAAAPTYDLEQKLDHEPWAVGGLATLGASASPDIHAMAPAEPGTPWFEQSALPIALVVACIVLAIVAGFALRSRPSA